MICGKCGVPLESIVTRFEYLGHDFTYSVPKCPICGQVCIDEELASGKIAEVETILEDK